ncbi:MAG TPA: potassium transporter TrkG, partial [bacterium]|nr:potassium transporter TrkG [bacterium]
EIWSRRIPASVVESAAIVVFLAAGLVATSVLVLSMTEDASLRDIIFEEVSAFGTVGLSLGLTPKLTDAGKMVIILSMLVGRLGPITLVLSLAQPRRRVGYDLPDAPIMIG